MADVNVIKRINVGDDNNVTIIFFSPQRSLLIARAHAFSRSTGASVENNILCEQFNVYLYRASSHINVAHFPYLRSSFTLMRARSVALKRASSRAASLSTIARRMVTRISRAYERMVNIEWMKHRQTAYDDKRMASDKSAW